MSFGVVGVAEQGAVAQYGDRAVLADGDDGGERVIAAVATARRMSRTAERFDGLLGGRARHQPHPEPAQHAARIEDGSAVDLRQGVSQRGEMKGSTDVQGWRYGKPLLDRGSRIGVGR